MDDDGVYNSGSHEDPSLTFSPKLFRVRHLLVSSRVQVPVTDDGFPWIPDQEDGAAAEAVQVAAAIPHLFSAKLIKQVSV